jgi:predicted RNase H-like nuclease
MARRPLQYSKKTPEGYDERREILSAALPCAVPTRDQVRQFGLAAHPDDLLDAAIAAVTAHRICRGTAERLPREPEFDARGLRMEMVY